MPAGKLDLLIEKGATYHKTLIWEVGDPGEPVDLTGYSARMQIRNTQGSMLLELTTSNARITLQPGGEAGRIDLLIEATDTEALAGSTAKYDLELVSGTEVTRLVQGDVTLSPEITKP